jgi:uncharacterized iron-regulated protein
VSRLVLLITAGALWVTTTTVATAASVKIDPTPTALAQAMQGHRVVLLGEVHDNAAQHALRAAALRQLVVNGARPAIAFEQFNREWQANIDRARHERPRDADYVIAQAKGEVGWRWDLYRHFVALALEYDLPIVAANVSRADAIQVAIDGWSAICDARTIDELKLDKLPAAFRRKHEDAIAIGHCNLLSAEELPARARAQMTRDIVMARSIRPYVDRGVVLLAGNGHVRRDIGVRFWLPADVTRNAISIGVLERDQDSSAPESASDFDAYVVTERAERPDPCKELAEHLHPRTSKQPR